MSARSGSTIESRLGISSTKFPVESLRPFSALELYGVVLRGPVMVPAEEFRSDCALLCQDIIEDKIKLARAMKSLGKPHVDRERALRDIWSLQARLVRAHLKLQRWSVGYRPQPHSDVEPWPERPA